MDSTVRKMTPAAWDHVVEVNLSGAFYLSRAILQHMLDRGSGRIIIISSVIGVLGQHRPGQLRRRQVGRVRTDDEPRPGDRAQGHHGQLGHPGLHQHRHDGRRAGRRPWRRSWPRSRSGRLGEPDEVARVVEFLASPDSGYITGQVYAVNGGLYM